MQRLDYRRLSGPQARLYRKADGALDGHDRTTPEPAKAADAAVMVRSALSRARMAGHRGGAGRRASVLAVAQHRPQSRHAPYRNRLWLPVARSRHADRGRAHLLSAERQLSARADGRRPQYTTGGG